MRKYLCLVLCAVAGSTCPTPGLKAQLSAATPGWFVFAVSPLDTPADAPMDVSFLNRDAADGRIRVRGRHFVDEQGRRVRFLGTNVTFSAAFPNKANAPALARRMAQVGFNVVRFHHMDARDIWLPGQSGLDPDKLDRLDWFIYQLKQNGIYTNLNLHVSRTYPGLGKLNAPRTFRFGKILDNFYEPYIEMQEQYARSLLDRVNPYTGLRVADDPAIAFVEINNENTLLNLRAGNLSEMPELFRNALRRKWAAWLEERYGSLARGLAAWNKGAIPLGAEILANGNFANGFEGWTLEGRKTGICTPEVVTLKEDGSAVRITMTEKGNVPWAYQLHQLGVALSADTTYTIRFRARTDVDRPISVGLRFAQAPWSFVAPARRLTLTTEWREHVVVARTGAVDPAIPLRLSLNLGDRPGSVWVRDVSLRSGLERFLLPGVAELADVPLPEARWPAPGWGDFRRFLVATEQAYVRRMKTFLTDRLEVKSLIVDTQASYGGYWGLFRETTFGDYVDMHAYWQHPRFPGKPWDGNNWLIPNTSMVSAANRGTFERLSQYRAADLPYSVSEYNHPAPNDHAAELFPMLSAYASHQDWDALYQFCYGNREDRLGVRKISSYFSLSNHSAQLVFTPLAALAFRLNLIPAAPGSTVLTVPVSLLDQNLASGMPGYGTFLEPGKASDARLFGTRFGVRFAEHGEKPTTVSEGDAVDLAGDGDGQTLAWHPQADKPVFLVRAPAIRMAVGEVGGRELPLGDLGLVIRPPDGTWACFAMAAKDGRPIAESRDILVAVATRAENTGMGWNENRTTVGGKWGKAPVVAQFVPFVMTLPGAERPRVHALDATGAKSAPIPVSGQSGAWRIAPDGNTPSLWYTIRR